MAGYIRQGDLLFIPKDFSAKFPKVFPNRVTNGVIAMGEATGHHHRVAEADMPFCEIYENASGQKALRVTEKGISIVHEEHHTVKLDPGEYVVHVAREFDYVERAARRVVD